jgi:glyoxylase-like metal-dependent hydrolase (beta-lactamase superfamily II)
MWISEMPSLASDSFEGQKPKRAGKTLCGLAALPTGQFLLGKVKTPAWAVLAILASFLLVTPRTLFSADEGNYKILEVKPHVFVWLAEDILEQEGDPNFSRAANAGFVVTPEGVVVVNTTNTPFNARALLYEIRQRTNLSVRFVINTSALPDAMLGNEAFEDFSPTILSTPAAAALISRYRSELPRRMEDDWRLKESMRGIHPTPPDQTFEQEMTLPVTSPPVRLINLGDAVSPGDAVVYLPRSKVLFLGNLFENQYIPRMDSGNIRRWISTLRRIEAWDVDVYVPAHGEPGGRQQVEQFRQFLEWLLNQVQARLRQGKTQQQTLEELVPFQNYHWRARELESKAVSAVYQQLAADNNETSVSNKGSGP